jgi:hypothetical protein
VETNAAMNLQRELRHKSESIDDLVPLDVVKALRRRVRKISHAYNVSRISRATAQTIASMAKR